MSSLTWRWRSCALALTLCVVGLAAPPASAQIQAPEAPAPAGCASQTVANVVALDQPWFWNRYGAMEPQGMMYALARDIVPSSDVDGLPDIGVTYTPNINLMAGQVKLRADRRPRPLVLRVNAGGCLVIHFWNLLAPTVQSGKDEQPATRAASIHVVGLEAVASIKDMGANLGTNGSGGNGVVASGGQADYTLYAPAEGTYVFYSFGAMAGGEGDSGSISAGLFGQVNVEPAGSEWYRSQVTRADLAYARTDPNAFSNTDAFPTINYGANFPLGHRYAGKPVLRMTAGNELVYGDLTAIITGPNAGALTNYLPTTNTYPNRSQPFREFSIAFHDEVGAVQAFPQFETDDLQFTLHSVRDAFAINYGTGGIGSEILANRLNVGPARTCPECKYEEFFLSSWALGDPAMIVDTPANAPCTAAQLQAGNLSCFTQGFKASKAFYPDDPTNVYHSYINDHVKFRNTHAGSDDHHIFHLHAHQWVHSPKSDLSSYKDSQAIGQGVGWTYEITYGGSGNRNKTVGDSIFHCHFYPHFAQGMWALWRTHDVLELGTVLNDKGKPTATARALPDAEILNGTPIPAIVPLPTLAMAPVPSPVWLNTAGQIVFGNSTVNPGYPFFIPGTPGHRPPHPPLDFALDPVTSQPLDGGLPRHVITGGTAVGTLNRFNMEKELTTAIVSYIPEAGTPMENVAMTFHAAPAGHTTQKPDGSAGNFKVNGHPAAQGAPYADPCWDDNGNQITDMRYYKAADIQIDAKINKAGWHFPQTRMIALWNDVASFSSGARPPEPFFFRASSGQCINFWLTNLIPNKYVVDDYQVRTPTDIVGQHIHLVKFDVTASDGAGNGWNYEDGSLAGEEVQERLCAIRRATPGLCGESAAPPPPAFPAPCNFSFQSASCPVPKVHPKFNGNVNTDCDEHNDYLGAQTTVQRWWADPITNLDNSKRTLRTVFTHDHFGPSTHQQTGLYAGLIVEPAGTTWYHNETGTQLSTNGGPGLAQDGGPTTWQANIYGGLTRANNYREFMLEFADFQPAYVPTGQTCPSPKRDEGWIDTAAVINPPGREEVEIDAFASPPETWLYDKPDRCPVREGSTTFLPPPCPEAIVADDIGMTSTNYRNEPLGLRVNVPGTSLQTAGLAGDLSYGYQSRTDRANPALNVQPGFYPPLTTGLTPGDPFTPLLRAFEGDQVKIRTLVGAHEEPHNMTVHGLKWLFEPEDPNSGWRNSQMAGISEWYDLVIPRIPSLLNGHSADFLYKTSAAVESQWNGSWGIIRVIRNDTNTRPTTTKYNLTPLDTANPTGQSDTPDGTFTTVGVDAARADKVPGGDITASTVTPASFSAGAGAFSGGNNPAPGSGNKASSLVSAPPEPLSPDERIKIPCPTGATMRVFDISAVAASEALAADPFPPGLTSPGLIYNARNPVITDPLAGKPGHVNLPNHQGPLYDPTAMMFVYTADLTYTTPGNRPRLALGVRREPLILRATAGECIKLRLRNQFPSQYTDLPGYSGVNPIIEHFNLNHVVPSMEVALHTQLVHTDIQRFDGSNVGLNPSQWGSQSVPVGSFRTFYWYAGDITGSTVTPIEFGATGLTSSDPIKQSQKGLMGMLVIEPATANWTYDTDGAGKTTRAAAAISSGTDIFKPFHEFAVVLQDDVNLRYASDNQPVENLQIDEDMENSGQKGVNYRAEPLWFRGRWDGLHGWNPRTDITGNDPLWWSTRKFTDFDKIFTNGYATNQEPETPIFAAKVTDRVRFRLTHPSGHTQAHVFELHGHPWQEEPYVNGSKDIGYNSNSEVLGTRSGMGPTDHADLVLLDKPGGINKVGGDYFYRSYPGPRVDAGMWGIFRVLP